MIMFLAVPNFISIVVANVIAIFILISVGVGSSYKLKEGSKESTTLIIMMVLVGIASILDPLVFLVDGNSGIVGETNWFFQFLNHFGNGSIYLLDLLVVIAWSVFLVYHLNGDVNKKRMIGYLIIASIAIMALTVNIFYPFIFIVDEMGVYKRVENGKIGFLLFTILDVSVLAESVLLFVRIRFKGGLLKFFPIWVFLVPTALGMVAQSVYYGISTINVGFALAICGMLMAMQNDLIYCDKLTGLYNRYYLDRLKKKMMSKRGNAEYTAMMLDLNGFKGINDAYGHQEGDNALIKSGELLRKAVASYGTVIRYAGDEFIIILNTQVDSIIREVVHSIEKQFDGYNRTHVVPYILSISFGYSKANFKEHTIDELMNEIDHKMYLDKEKRKNNNE